MSCRTLVVKVAALGDAEHEHGEQEYGHQGGCNGVRDKIRYKKLRN
jgi:hypothetical protein